jgi:hypothetical protein
VTAPASTAGPSGAAAAGDGPACREQHAGGDDQGGLGGLGDGRAEKSPLKAEIVTA